MNIILFDPPEVRENLLPFTFTRPVGAIRCGILTLAEKWAYQANATVSFHTQPYLKEKFEVTISTSQNNILVAGNIFPDAELLASIKNLQQGQALLDADHQTVAMCLNHEQYEDWCKGTHECQTQFKLAHKPMALRNTYHIFALNDAALRADFVCLTQNRQSAPIPFGTQAINEQDIFIEEGAVISHAILNASTGPIYIGRNTDVMEGCKIRGPFALCDHAGLKMDAKIYGATTIGPHCRAGGELNNVVMFGYSNKGHDGFLGNAVIGEWCNIGADTNNSNLKNTYEEVKLWNYRTERFERTGLTFCGLIMGDHAKCGINTMFNTGTVVGVGANIFGAGFPRNFIPSFAWGGAQGFETFQLSKFFKTAEAMCSRRGVVFDATEKAIIDTVYVQSAKFRFWEKERNTANDI